MATVGVPEAVDGRLYALWRLAGAYGGLPPAWLASGFSDKALELPTSFTMRALHLAYPIGTAEHTCEYVMRVGAAEVVWTAKAVLPQIKKVRVNSIKNEQIVVAMYFLKNLLLAFFS